jgi:putative permease
MPVLVAGAIAYLLDWPVVKLTQTGLSRILSTVIIMLVFVGVSALILVGLIPVLTRQGMNLIREMPQIWERGQSWFMQLPERYPEFVQLESIMKVLDDANLAAVELGEQLLSASFSSLFDIAALLIYAILVPLMVFFMLKDKQQLLSHLSEFLPQQRRLIEQVGREMNEQIASYIRGKVIEILIIGSVSATTFALLDLRYALLLGVLVGFSVLIPYIGAALVTIPVMAVALFQWGLEPAFWYVTVAYIIIQVLDGNLLVPVLFSEAVSLHPVYIIIAVLFFGGLLGFWGVFFAIPLASLVRALITAWSGSETDREQVSVS